MSRVAKKVTDEEVELDTAISMCATDDHFVGVPRLAERWFGDGIDPRENAAPGCFRTRPAPNAE